MIGIDISKWQKDIKLSELKVDFVIMKATEGISYIDPYFEHFAKESSQLGLLQGCYHFARPDLQTTSNKIKEAMSVFIKEIERVGLLNKSILVIDWETMPIEKVDLLLTALDYLRLYTDATPFVYASLNVFKNQLKNIPKIYPKWVAYYGNNNRIHKLGDTYSIRFPDIEYDILQYTSNGIDDSYAKPLDLDITNLTKEKWLRMAGVKETLSEDMKWAIELGLFSGHVDGTFRPNDPLTRAQAATLFRKYTSIMVDIIKEVK